MRICPGERNDEAGDTLEKYGGVTLRACRIPPGHAAPNMASV